MRKTLTIGLATGLLAATLSFVAARSQQQVQVASADLLSADDILTTVRAMGLSPIGEVVRRGPYYVLHAFDRRGREVRVVADGQFGDILSVRPAHNVALAPPNSRPPRIIHVPQPGDDRSTVPGRDGPAADDGEDDANVAPPRAGRLTPVYPTPHFTAQAGSGGKFAAPRDRTVTGSTPPGYAPPSAISGRGKADGGSQPE